VDRSTGTTKRGGEKERVRVDWRRGSIARRLGRCGVAAMEKNGSRHGSKTELAEEITGSQVKWMNVSYTVTVVSGHFKKRKTEKKALLQNVSGEANPSEVLAIMGPSGAGKSTLLDAISGRIESTSMEGHLLVNGHPMGKKFQRQSGYVMQDDVLYPHLTVRESILYAARLRLPRSVSRAEKEKLVDELLKELGLTKAAKTKIGNEEVRGVSGGEKRRVSIGVEMIHRPRVLFLDEPTSGLDSTSALNVVQSIKALASVGRTIVLTVHQPSQRIITLFDKVLIMCLGYEVYFGKVEGLEPHLEAVAEFSGPGAVANEGKVPHGTNVVEYTLDLLEDAHAPLIDYWSKCKVEKEKSMRFEENEEELKGGVVVNDPKYALDPLTETLVLSERAFKNTLRTPELFLGRIGLCVTTGVLIGSAFFDLGSSYVALQMRQGLYAFTAALFIFTSIEGLPAFLSEKLVFTRDVSRGAYRVYTFVLAQTITNLPFFVPLALLFSIPTWFMAGFQNGLGASNFFFFALVQWATLVVANYFVLALATLVPNYIVGNSLISALAAFMFLVSGFFLPQDEIPPYWIWLHYISLFTYAINAMLKNDFEYTTNVWDCPVIPGGNGASASGTDADCPLDGSRALEAFDATPYSRWFDFGMLMALAVFFRIFTAIVLTIRTRDVRK